MIKTDYTREELITICEQAIAPESEWDSIAMASTQEEIGSAWLFLKAGCKFRIVTEKTDEYSVVTDEEYLWIEFSVSGVSFFESNGSIKDKDYYVLPTPEHLAKKGHDWY